MPPTPPIPNLASLGQRPSWHNRAGRTDRSCCFAITAAALWRLIPDDAWQQRPAAVPRPDTPAPRRPDRVGPITLTAEDLYFRHRHEKPNPLRGDYRTPKANAFKPVADATAWWNEFSNQPAPGSSNNATHGSSDHCVSDPTRYPRKPFNHPSSLDPPAINPNRGAGFSMGLKKLGLPFDWYTTLHIERYPQHANLKQHFLVCPVCGPRPREDDSPAAAGSQPADALTAPSAGRGPAAKKLTAAKKPPGRLPGGLPGGRVTKLFLPLCTEREWEDAQRAHLWLTTHTNPNRPYTDDAQRLITRYAELFPGRNLRCRTCLGLRYGEVKGLKR